MFQVLYLGPRTHCFRIKIKFRTVIEFRHLVTPRFISISHMIQNLASKDFFCCIYYTPSSFEIEYLSINAPSADEICLTYTLVS